MPTVRLRGIDLYYELEGSGPRLLFVNGSGATLESAALLVNRLRGDFELVAHDQRGLGRTSVPDTPPTMHDFAADALDLADHVGWDTFRVFGISFGGMVAQELAVTSPDRVERLALLCTSPGGPALASYPLHDLLDGAEVSPTILDSRYATEWLSEHPIDAFIADGFVNNFSSPAPGFVQQLEARRNHDVRDRLDRIECPTFVAAGRYDGIAPLPNSEAIAAAVAGSELHIYEGGHLFVAQDPTALPEIVEFLSA